MNTRSGFTIFELLIAVAIVGILASVAVVSGRQVLQDQQQNAALNTLQQSIWQGATSAAARGASTELVRSGNQFSVRRQDNKRVLRRFELAKSVTSNLPQGVVLRFTPPGKIDPASMQNLPATLTLTTKRATYKLTLSLIGEVKHEVIP